MLHRNEHRVAAGPALDAAALAHYDLRYVAARIERVCHACRLLDVLHVEAGRSIRKYIDADHIGGDPLIHLLSMLALPLAWHGSPYAAPSVMHHMISVAVVLLVYNGLRNYHLVLVSCQDFQVVVLGLIVRLVVRWRHLNVGNGVDIVLESLIAARIRDQVSIALFVVQLLELLDLVGCRRGEHVDDGLDFLGDLG